MIVYLITNTLDGKFYIGKYEGRCFSSYKKQTFREALSGSKKKPHLYSAIRKHGEECFVFTILAEVVERATVRFWESFFIEFTDARERGYNISTGYEPPSRKGSVNSKAHRRRIVEAQTENWKEHRQERIEVLKNVWAKYTDVERGARMQRVREAKRLKKEAHNFTSG